MATDTKTRVPGERRIDDAGIKIGGARKDFSVRAMTLEDIDAMTPAEQAELVSKDHVWPVPDFAAMVEAGVPAVVAAHIKLIRDRIGAKPNVEQGCPPAEAARNYIRVLTVAKEVLEDCKSKADVEGAERRILAAIGYSRLNRGSISVAFSVTTKNRLPFDVEFNDSRRAAALVTAGFPGDIPPWKRGVRVQKYMNSQGYYFSASKASRTLVRSAATEEALWVAVKAAYEQKKEDKKANPEAFKSQNPDHPHLAHLRREGPDNVTASKDVAPDAFIETFGFRGVEFGLWLPDNERQEVLNLGFDAFHDLAWVLDIHHSQLGLTDTMSMAFGARGKGKAAAHYEPGRKVINATKLSGAGKVAHEFGHALDHWLGAKGNVDEVENGYARYASGARNPLVKSKADRSRALPNLDPQFVKAINAVMNTILWRPVTREEWLAEREKKLAVAQAKILRGEKELAEHRAKEGYKPTTRKGSFENENVEYVAYWTRTKENAERVIQEENDKPMGVYGDVNTDYVNQALALCGPSGEYWARPTELLARAFEAFAFDKLVAAGRRSDYLVHSVEAGRFSNAMYKGDPYPTGEERNRINAAFQDLTSLLHKMLPTPEHALREAEEMAAQPAPAPVTEPVSEVVQAEVLDVVQVEAVIALPPEPAAPAIAAEVMTEQDLSDEQLLQALLGDIEVPQIAVLAPVVQPAAEPIVQPLVATTPAAKLRAKAPAPKPNAKQMNFGW